MTQEHDQQIEQEIQEKGLAAPRVTAEHIQGLVDKLEYTFIQVSPKRLLCQASLGDFWIADGTSVCVDPKNFNRELGEKYSRENAEDAARNKLWEFEGYRLFCKLNDVPEA